MALRNSKIFNYEGFGGGTGAAGSFARTRGADGRAGAGCEGARFVREAVGLDVDVEESGFERVWVRRRDNSRRTKA